MNILLTSVGRRKYLVEYFKEALNGIGQLHVSNSEYTYSMKSADSYVLTPLIYDEGYIPTLLDYCIKNNVDALLSLFDVDLLVLARNRGLFLDHGTKIILASEQSVRICNDKWETYLFLTQNGIKAPSTYLSIKDAVSDIRRGKTQFPLVIKPRWGMGSIGINYAENEEELNILYQKSTREVYRSYLKYESRFTKDQEILIQEKLVGQEHGLDVVNDLSGKYVKTYAKKKVAMRAGETDIGETVNSRRFEKIGRALSEKIQHEGVLSVDCFVTDKGIFVTEMNCRFSGHYPISHLAGVELPKQIVKWLGNEGTDRRLLQCKEGVCIIKDIVPCIMQQNET
jgi:carbamoyl-phosphate synthase large subunit